MGRRPVSEAEPGAKAGAEAGAVGDGAVPVPKDAGPLTPVTHRSSP